MTNEAKRNEDTVEPLVRTITHGGTDARYKLCRCSVCGLEAICEPMCDFYTRTGDPSGPLFCEVCILKPNATITGGDSRPVHGLVGETNQEDRT